ncbi:MAG: hypothetical protein QXR18_07855, partial [Pyrobaculum sp.]
NHSMRDLKDLFKLFFNIYTDVGTDYLSALIYYLYRKKWERGGTVAIKTREICGVDKRCSWHLLQLMTLLVERGIAQRYKKGVYLIQREKLEKAVAALREAV